MSVVKVTVYSANAHVFACLCCHLKLLHTAYTVLGIENGYLYLLDILVSLKRRFTGITGSCNEDKRFSFFTGTLKCACEKSWHYLKRHILERAGRAVPKLKGVHIISYICQGSGASNERGFVVYYDAIGQKLIVCIIGEEFRKDFCRSYRV